MFVYFSFSKLSINFLIITVFRPETWMDVFTVVPVICFGYQVRLFMLVFKISVNFLIFTSTDAKGGKPTVFKIKNCFFLFFFGFYVF